MPQSHRPNNAGSQKKQRSVSLRKTLGLQNIRPREKRGITALGICSSCSSVFFEKKWYSKQALKKHVQKNPSVVEKGFAVWFDEQPKKETLCAACKQKKNFSEGIVYLQSIPAEEKKELLRHIANIGERAKERDAEDAIVKIEEQGNDILVYTSENQLAVSIAKQIAKARKGGMLEIKFSKSEDAVRVYWMYPQK